MMVDLTPQNRLIRKRNMLLQKQLDVRLQIMTEEYRMTKKDLERNCKDLGGFLMYLRHTAPGLSAYGQPDTRAMNAKNIIRNSTTDSPDDIEKKKAKELLYQQLNKSGDRRDRMSSERSDNEGTDGPPPRPPRNEFFNKRIVLDSKRRSFLQHNMMKDSGKPSSADPRDDLRRLGGAISHAGFLSNRDTPGEASSKKRPQTASPAMQRPRTARYGSDAYSEQDENARKEILNRFDYIFDPQNVKPEGKLRQRGLAATPIVLPKSDSGNSNLDQSNLGLPASNYILNRRVAWSAPPKRREAPNEVNSNAPHPPANRQTMSVTPRSGTTAYNYRCSSAAPIINREAGPSEMEANRITESQMAKRNPPRPKTAPPVYQLMQRNVAAPRQQVAGIMAEIQSRRAETRAILLKSKQLKKMVKSLAPQEVNEDELSD